MGEGGALIMLLQIAVGAVAHLCVLQLRQLYQDLEGRKGEGCYFVFSDAMNARRGSVPTTVAYTSASSTRSCRGEIP